jgi:cysteine desulfurase
MPTKKLKTTKNTISPCKTAVVYLDNNGTTKMCREGKNAMIAWLDSGSNPSSDSIISKKSAVLIDHAKKYINKHCGVNYKVVFTSGASESNCLILRSVADSYYQFTKKKPHIITSATEHKSVIVCCNELLERGRANITYIEPNGYGCIDPSLVEKAITHNTALISIMAANNELGCINNIKQIGEIAAKHKVPCHTDAVQIFGKYKLPMKHIDAMSVSFHKLYGPMGLGLLLLNPQLVEGYALKGQISGSQQESLRGGTENVPAIASAIAAMKHTFNNRDMKNKKMSLQKKKIIHGLEQVLPLGKYKNYFSKSHPKRDEFLVLGPECNGNYKKPNVLPNTILLSIVKNTAGEPFCNINLKKFLYKKNIIVSIGSACSTKELSASHVLYAIKAPEVVRRGVIRISLSDNTTNKDISMFLKALIAGIRKQLSC